MSDYCSSTDIKAQLPDSLGGTTDITYDAQLGVLITAASRLIDREVGQLPDYFYPSTDTQTLYFDGNDEQELEIGDWVSVSTVSMSEDGGVSSSDYTAFAATDWYLWPYNSTPKWKLVIDSLNGAQSEFYAYRKSVKVAGIPGYSTTPPADVKMACVMQTTRWFMKAKNAFQLAGANQEVGTIRMDKLDPDIAMLLYHYKLEHSA